MAYFRIAPQVWPLLSKQQWGVCPTQWCGVPGTILKMTPLQCRVTWTLNFFFFWHLERQNEVILKESCCCVSTPWKPCCSVLTICLMEEEKQPVQNNEWLLIIPRDLESNSLQPKPSLHLSPTFSHLTLLSTT